MKVASTFSSLPLKRVVQINKRTLGEDTPADRFMRYVDISNVNENGQILEPQELVFENAPSRARRLVSSGDTIISTVRTYLKAIAYLPHPDPYTVVSTGFAVLSPQPEVDPRYLAWAVRSSSFVGEVVARSAGVSYPAIAPTELGNIPLPIHSRPIQSRIADFLDRETAQIDALIDEKEQLLKLLDERRRALITEVVTRGLDPTVPMKQSGHPWLGTVPAHWLVERTRWLFKERDERSADGAEELLTVSHLTGVTPRSEKDVTMFLAESNEGYKVCHVHDLVINTMWAWMGAMGVSWGHGICSPSYNVYEPDLSLIDPEFLDCLSRMPTFVQEVTRYSKGVWSSRLRLYPEGLYQVCLALPPLNEQRAIVDNIRNTLKNMAKVMLETTSSIQTLRSLRQSVIEDAVSGGPVRQVGSG